MNNLMGRVAAIVLAFVLAVGLVPASAVAAGGRVASGLAAAMLLVPQALVAPNYSWYTANPDADEFTVGTPAALVGFANLVNGTAPADVSVDAVSFEGATIRMTANMNLKAQEWVPVGDAAHPFEGTFDGGKHTVNNFKVSGTDRAAYLGLFGYIGSKGAVADVTVGSSASIAATRAKATKQVIHHIAGIAGYCAGSMSGCTNNAKVTVTSAVVQTKANPQVVLAVGGVAGECTGAMTECANNAVGAVSVTVSSAAVASVDDSGLARYVGGVAGASGDISRIGKPTAEDELQGSMSGCVNLAKVTVETPSTAGTDRFGEVSYSRSVCVGGVVGYARGDVSDCENGLVAGSYLNSATASCGYVRAEHGTAVGGIAGSLRATPSTSNSSAGRVAGDDGFSDADPDGTPIVLSGCTNYGDVYALNAVGGIVGSAGSHTLVSGCINSRRASATFVVATRWNKPAPAGIVGATNGDVAYCANFATVASGTWKDEASRTLQNGAGYYASGIAGMLTSFSKATSTGSAERTSPVPEVRGCYNAGFIMAVSGMRQRGLVGENGGYVHDNALLKGVVEHDELTYDEGMGGTAANNEVLAAADLRGKDGVAAVNRVCDSDGWVMWWVLSDATATTSAAANLGYPVLAGANPVAEDARTDLSGFAAACADAAYTGGTGGSAAVPAATVTDGDGAELVQNVDFRVVPQDGAVEVGSGYTARIVGIGRYRGTTEDAAYSIAAGKMSDCRVTVEPATFDFEGHYPSADMITVTTSGGAVIDPSEYAISRVALWRSGKENTVHSADNPPINASPNYRVTVRPVSGSEHFSSTTGTTSWGSYRINAADLQTDVKYDGVKVTFKSVKYPWVNSSDEASTSKPKTTLPYTGSAVKPVVSGLTYQGHALVEGKDYRVVYGNPNPITTNGGDSLDANNKGNANGTSVGCVTVRYLSGGNFTSYQNMFFNITNGLASAKVTVANQAYTGKALTPVPTVKVGATTLKKGAHYTVAYKNNKAIGTATATITGKAGTKYAGVKTATFKIGKKNPITVKSKNPTVTYSKTTARTIAAKNAIAVSKAQGKVTYKKTGGNANITVSSAGKVTVKKATKRTTYPIKVTVTAAGNKTYLPATKTVTVKVKVK